MNSNQCPECGGVASHYLTDISGKTYYKCNTGLTSFGIAKVSKIVPCETIIDQNRVKPTATLAYISDGKIETLTVIDGKERR